MRSLVSTFCIGQNIRLIMGKFHDGKRRWNETIAAQAFKNAPAAALSAQKRYSGTFACTTDSDMFYHSSLRQGAPRS